VKVLAINCGSSSIRWAVFDVEGERELDHGRIEEVRDADEAWIRVRRELRALPADRTPEAVGHRVVHGGERFTESVRIDAAVLREIEAQIPLAPEHNPRCLHGIREAMGAFPDLLHVAVFDTAFHQTMPPEAYVYPIPYVFHERDRIRRYGFHGTSHRYAAERGAHLLGIAPNAFTGITCHLGNGASIAAIRAGRSVDTSMGMTPLEGLMMGTRSGDMDPGVVLELAARAELGPEAVATMLNQESGLLGVSGVSSDLRRVEAAAAEGDARAKLAVELFAHRVRRGVGAALGVLGGAMAIIVTGGIGEHASAMRSRIFGGLEGLGLVLDDELNRECLGREGRLSNDDASLPLFVVPAREEWLIARETAASLA